MAYPFLIQHLPFGFAAIMESVERENDRLVAALAANAIRVRDTGVVFEMNAVLIELRDANSMIAIAFMFFCAQGTG